VEVAAHLAPPLLSRLRATLEHEHTLIIFDDWRQLAEAVRVRPIDVVVVDPRADGRLRIDEVTTLVERHPSVPVVVYAVLAPEMLHGTVELARSGVRHMVLRGFDDEPRRFRELLERLPARQLDAIILERLRPKLEPAPALLRRAIAELFESPHRFRSVPDLARAAGMTRRNLDRWLDRLGLASGRMLLMGARTTRAVHYMRDPGFLLEDITRKLGYESPRLFARQVRAVTGLSPSILRGVVQFEKVIEQLAEYLCRRGGREQ
jgi:AraC-like DNA-binding protein